MKKIFIILTLFLFLINLAFAQNGPSFLELDSDKASYGTGEKAVLLSHVNLLPTNANYELFVEATFNGEEIFIVKLTDKEWASVTPTLNTSGSFIWEVRAYVQDKREAQELEGSLAFYENKLISCQGQLQTTTDPEQIALLEESIAISEEIISELEMQLAALRTLVEISTLNVNVDSNVASLRQSTTFPDPSFFIDSDRENHIYQVGENATLFVHILTGIEGQEIVVRASFDSEDIGITKSSDKEFISTTDVFVASDIGDHTYSVTILTRDKSRADSYKEAILNATVMRNSYIEKRNNTQDPIKKAYFQKKIGETTLIIQALYGVLESSLTVFGQGNFFIHVEA